MVLEAGVFWQVSGQVWQVSSVYSGRYLDKSGDGLEGEIEIDELDEERGGPHATRPHAAV